MLKEIPADDKAYIRAVVENKGDVFPRIPELADLPQLWDRIGSGSEREEVVRRYVHEQDKRWAWDGLNRLLVTLQERREPIPFPLANWACEVVAKQYQGTLKVPRQQPGNSPYAAKHDRHMRIAIVVKLARQWFKLTREDAIAEVALAIGEKEGTVVSAVRKMQKFVPFNIVPKG